MSNLHLWLTRFRYTVEIKLHAGVRVVDTAVKEKEKKTPSVEAMGTVKRARGGKKKMVKTICGKRHKKGKGRK